MGWFKFEVFETVYLITHWNVSLAGSQVYDVNVNHVNVNQVQTIQSVIL